MSMPTSSPMSPTQAAHAIGTSRRTIMRAIATGDLEAFRDNRNHWKIPAKALDEWANAHAMPTVPTAHLNIEPLPAHPKAFLEQGAELQVEREARRQAEIEAAELRGKLAATEAERDRLHEIVQRLSEPKPPQPSKRRSWWWRRN